MIRFIRLNFLGLAVAGFLLTGCHQSTPTSKAGQTESFSSVSVAHPHIENKSVYTEFQGVSSYLQSVHFNSQSTGVISTVFVQPGDIVKKGDPLLVIKPVEISALENTKLLSQHQLHIRDTLYSGQDALINQVSVQEGDYVQPGSLLISAFKKSSLSAIVYVPFQQVALINKNKNCLVEIPGKKAIKARFGRKLFLADSTSQTQPFVVKLPSDLMLSSGINLHVKYKIKEIKNGLFIPRPALLSNEEETHFFVMKIKGGNTAVNVPVTVGWQGKKIIQITSGNLTVDDQVITEGAYGLANNTKVQIDKN